MPRSIMPVVGTVLWGEKIMGNEDIRLVQDVKVLSTVLKEALTSQDSSNININMVNIGRVEFCTTAKEQQEAEHSSPKELAYNSSQSKRLKIQLFELLHTIPEPRFDSLCYMLLQMCAEQKAGVVEISKFLGKTESWVRYHSQEYKIELPDGRTKAGG